EQGDVYSLARAAVGYGGSWWQTGYNDEELVEALDEAVTALPEEDTELRARALARLSVELWRTPVAARREALSSEALAIARRLGRPGAIAAALMARHYALLSTGRL